MLPNPKNLILNLLLANDGAPLSAADAVGSCALFGIRENSVRVALVRLGAAGLIASAGRGAYRLGPQAADLAQELSSWRSSESRVCEWHGAWIMVSTGHLGRSDRTALRTRQRALALLGFKELNDALHVRPDNLLGHAPVVRERLRKLGLELDAPVFTATDLTPELDALARTLWQSEALTSAYRQTRQKLQAWLAHADDLEPEVAARESYLLGNEAIRQLVFDPLLPEPLVDTAERRAFTATVLAFDEAGHRIWRERLPAALASRVSPMAETGSPAADKTAKGRRPSSTH
ncbi:PaaX family transcriptional regulator C-terminal domain-containing protein [Aquabacterium sp. NJ1]|uniref:PaaX family transcriptional regulator C-terminal domain-containing protein n=1 Tax=Aquabacterium sp. NJ1 TaxID=1538295 RepID=UPI0009DD69DC|nr:PaaX family transcriptional regulator C-terminal domain-containing protein [Aquabacterium sp. NJ1]